MGNTKAFLVFILMLCGFFITGCDDSKSDPAGPDTIIAEFTDVDIAVKDMIDWGKIDVTNLFELAQSFYVPENAGCSSVKLLLDTPKGSPSGDYTVRLETDASGSPSGTLVSANAEASLWAGSIIQWAWNSWPFDVPILLAGGQTYWIVCRTDESAAEKYISLVGANSNQYSGGTLKFSLNGGPWTNYDPYDLNFMVLR